MVYEIKARIFIKYQPRRQVAARMRLKSLFLLLLLAISAPIEALQAADTDPSYPRADGGSNVRAAEKPVAADCDHAWSVSGARTLCAQRRPGKLLQLVDGQPVTEFAAVLTKPELVATSARRIAVIDDDRLLVFDRQGRQLNIAIKGLLVRAQAVAFVGRFIMVLDRSDRHYRLYDHDGAPISADPESMHQLQLKKPFALAGDAQGNLYVLDSAHDEILVFNLETGRTLLLPVIDDGKAAKLLDLATDENDRLYVLLRGKDRKFAIWILRGAELQYRFALPSISKPADLHTIAGAAGRFSVFDARENILHRFDYLPVPDRVIGLRARGYEHHVVLTWHPQLEHDARSYVLYGSESDSGPLEKLGTYTESTAVIRYGARRPRRFAVSAIGAAGGEGPMSMIADNEFEPAFNEYRNANYEVAARLFARASNADPENESVLKYLGRSLMHSGRVDHAAQVFRQWQISAADRQDADLHLAMALFHQQQWLQADPLMNGLLKTKQPDAQVLLLCADLYQAMGQTSKAEACLRQELGRDKDNRMARLRLAQLQTQPKQRRQAVAEITGIENGATRNKDSGLLLAIGRAYDALDQPGKAVAVLDRALLLEPGLTSAMVAKGEMLFRRKRFNEARSVALEMIQKPDLQAEGYHLMADTLSAQQRPGEAIIAYRKSVTLKPALSGAWIGMAQTYRQLKNNAQFEATLTQALVQHPGSYDLWLMRGQQEFADGHFEQATTPLLRANRLRPGSPAVTELLAKTYHELGQLDAALLFGRLTLQHRADDLSLLEMLAGISRKQGNYPRAITYYRKALTLKKNSSHYTHALGASYYDAGNFASARHHLERARKLNSGYTPTTRLLAKTYHELKMYSAAIKLMQAMIKSKPRVEDQLYLKQLNTERSQYQKKMLSIESAEAVPVYTSLLPGKDELSMMKVTLKNRGSRSIEGITVRLYMDEFLGQPVTVEVPALAASRQVTVELKAPAKNMKFWQPQDKVVLAELQVSYPSGNGVVEANRSRPVLIRGTRTINWANPASLTSMVDVSAQCSAGVEQLARKSLAAEVRHLPDLPLRLMALATTLSAYDVTLLDAESRADDSFIRVHSEALIMQSHTATPDDLRAMIYTCLRQSGFEVEIVPGSMSRLVVNSGLPWDRRNDLTLNGDLLTSRDDRAWITIDSRLLIRGVAQAWIKAIDHPVQPEPVNRKPPGSLRTAGGKHTEIDLDPASVADDEMRQWLFAHQLPGVLEKMAGVGEPGNAVANGLSVATRFAENGFPELAIVEYRKLIHRNRYHAIAYERLADIYAARGQNELAVDYFRAAARVNLFDVELVKRESAALQRLEGEARQRLAERATIVPRPVAVSRR